MNYKIQSGDTLGALARKFGTSVDALAKANQIKDPNKIRAGAQLVVPDKFEAAAPQAHRSAPAAGDGFDARPQADRSGVTAPAMPPPNATVAEKTRFIADSQKYLTALEATGLRAPVNFTKPPMPSVNATAQELAKYTRDVRTYAAAMTPAQVSEPRMPDANATDEELAQFEKDWDQYAKTLPRSAADRSNVTAPAMPQGNASVADKTRYVADTRKYLAALEATGLRAPANYTVPPMPSPNATVQELARYTRDIRAYAAAMQ